MFSNCSSLMILPDVAKWNIQNVKYMEYMFSGCRSLTSISDLDDWNKAEINKTKMFSGCDSLPKKSYKEFNDDSSSEDVNETEYDYKRDNSNGKKDYIDKNGNEENEEKDNSYEASAYYC